MPRAVQFSQSTTPHVNFTAWVTGDERFAIIPAKSNTQWVVFDRVTLALVSLPDNEPFDSVRKAKDWVTRYVRQISTEQ